MLNQEEVIWCDNANDFLRSLQNIFTDSFSKFNKEITDDIAKEAVVILGFQCLRLLDAITILIEQGRCDVALILIRSLFEVMLQLSYLIIDKSYFEEKAAFFFVVSQLKKYDYNRKSIKNIKVLAPIIGKEKIKKGEEENSKIIKLLEETSGSIKEAYNFIVQNKEIGVNKNWSNREWFQIFNQKKKKKEKINNRYLCAAIQFYDGVQNDKKVLMYDVLYNFLSQQTHGSASIENIIIYEGVQKFRNYDCLQHGYWEIDFIYKMFLKISIDMSNIFGDDSYINTKELSNLNEYKEELKQQLFKLFY